jgi:hypothetical protein
MTLYNEQDPNEFVRFEDDDQYDDVPVKPAKVAKSAKQAKVAKDSPSKGKKTVSPVVSRYEGWMVSFVDIDNLQAGQTPSWSKSRKDLLPFSLQELQDSVAEQEKREGNLSHQFSRLCSNQRQIVNRLVADKNSEEQQTNAEWVLLCVKKLHKETRTAFRTYKINDRMRVIMRRQEKPMEVAEPIGHKVVDENIIDLSIPVKPTKKKEASPKATKDEKVKGEKKKVNKKPQAAQDKYGEQWQGPDPFLERDPFQHQHDPFQQPQDPFHQQHDPFQQQHDPFHRQQGPFQQQQGPFQQQQHQPHHDPFQQHQQQHVPFQNHQQQHDHFHQQHEQPPHADPFDMHEMSGALPNADGRIPIPVSGHGHPPEAPMAPQHPHQHPFQPFVGVRQADPRSDPRQHEPPGFSQPHFSARHRDESRSRTRQEPERDERRRSHSRPRRESRSRTRQEPEREPRRDSVDSNKIRRKEARKLETLKTELLGEVRGEVLGALREAAAEDKVHRWPTGASYPSYPPTASSGQSTRQDDMWSSPPSSDGRRYSHGGSPDTSPERSERFYPQREQRPAGSLHRHNSSGYASPRHDDRRYYQDRDRVVRPHNTQRERERHREDIRARSPKYISERREVVDDYPDVQYHRQQQQRREPKAYVDQRPRVQQRRVTDYPSTLPNADFSGHRRRDSAVDYTDQRVYGDSRERRGGQRERQPVHRYQ